MISGRFPTHQRHLRSLAERGFDVELVAQPLRARHPHAEPAASRVTILHGQRDAAMPGPRSSNEYREVYEYASAAASSKRYTRLIFVQRSLSRAWKVCPAEIRPIVRKTSLAKVSTSSDVAVESSEGRVARCV